MRIWKMDVFNSEIKFSWNKFSLKDPIPFFKQWIIPKGSEKVIAAFFCEYSRHGAHTQWQRKLQSLAYFFTNWIN